MYLFEVTPEKRILLELLVIVLACLVAVIIDTSVQQSAKRESKATGARKAVTGH